MNTESVENDNMQIFLTHTGYEILSQSKIDLLIILYNYYGYIGNFENDGLDDEYNNYHYPTYIKTFKHTSKFRVDPVPYTGKFKYYNDHTTKCVGRNLRLQNKFESEGHKIRSNQNYKKRMYNIYEYDFKPIRAWKNNKRRKQWMSNKSQQLLKRKNQNISHKRSLKTVLSDTQNYDDHIFDVNIWFFIHIDCARPEHELQKNRKYLRIDGIGLYPI